MLVLLCLQTTIYLSPVSGCSPFAAQLDPWCWTLLWPDCTWSEVLVQDFQRRVTWSQTYVQILVSTTCVDGLNCARRATHAYSGRCLGGIALRWMVCILSRESFKQTVQPFKGTWCIPRRVSPGGTIKGERCCSYLAIVTGSSTLPQSMNAVVHMDANNAVDPSWSTGNSGLPLSWQGRLLTQASHKLRPCPLWKHCDLPSLWMQNTKVVNLRHTREQFNKRVLLCDTVLKWAKQLCVFLRILYVLLVHSLFTAASSTHCCGQRRQRRWCCRQHWVQWPPQACRPFGRAALEQLSFCHRQWGGYPSQVESVGITIRAPKSLKWNLHKERSDTFRRVRANSLEL